MSQVLGAIWVWSLADHKFSFRNIVHYKTCPWLRTIYHRIMNKHQNLFQMYIPLLLTRFLIQQTHSQLSVDNIFHHYPKKIRVISLPNEECIFSDLFGKDIKFENREEASSLDLEIVLFIDRLLVLHQQENFPITISVHYWSSHLKSGFLW